MGLGNNFLDMTTKSQPVKNKKQKTFSWNVYSKNFKLLIFQYKILKNYYYENGEKHKPQP